MAYTVNVRGLGKSYGDHTVLSGIDLEIDTGTVYGLLGPNGAGKTTLVRILATLIPFDTGTVEIGGHDLVRDPAAIRSQISLTGQHVSIDEALTAEGNLHMMAQLRNFGTAPARQRARELLDEFDLEYARGRKVGEFSGGMKRRLDLAISMIQRPRLLFLDEPTTGLDPRSREQVWSAVSQLTDDGVTVLLTTQYLEEADRLADIVGVLDHGTIIAEGTPSRLKEAAGVERVRLQFDHGADAAYAGTLFMNATADTGELSVDIPTDGSVAALAEIASQCQNEDLPVRRISTLRPSLDDVFLQLTSRQLTDTHLTDTALAIR